MILGARQEAALEAPRRGHRWRSSATRATCPRRSSTTSRWWAGASTTDRDHVALPELIGGSRSSASAPRPACSTTRSWWMNGVYLRALRLRTVRRAAARLPADRGSPIAGAPDRIDAVAPLVQEKIATLGEFEALCRSCSSRSWTTRTPGTRSPGTARGRDPRGGAARAGGVRLDGRRRRGRAARHLGASSSSSRASSSGRCACDHGPHHLAGPVRVVPCWGATRRWAASRPPPRGSPSRRAGRRARRARGLRRRTLGSRAPRPRRSRGRAAAAASGDGQRAPGSDASEPAVICAARPSSGRPGASACAMSERVRPARRPPA